MIIKAKLDVKKIDKSRLYVGEKGTYLDITLLESKSGEDQYGNNFMVVQDVSKADREAGVKGAILGNAKFVEARQQQPPKQQENKNPKPPIDPQDVPF